MAFCGYLKQSTAVDILLGPFMDDADGDTADTDATLDVELSKNGQPLADSESAAPTHDAAGTVDGYYNCVLGTTDTNTLGILTVVVHHADDLPVRQDYQVVTANWFDTMCSTEKLQVDAVEISSDSTAADNLELMYDGTGYVGGTTKLGVDAVAISGDTTAANNLELQYDGTGLIGDSFPFSQAAGAALGGGISIGTTMASVAVILGSEQNLSNASTSDDSRWTGDDDGSGAEFIFRCTPVSTSGIPVELSFEGYYSEPSGSTNGATLQVYNFNTVGWDTIIALTNSTKDEDHEVPLSHAHKAPGGGTLETVAYTIGDVLLKFKQDTQETGNACLLIDRMAVGFVNGLVTASDVVDEWESQSQSDPTGFHVNVKEVNGTAQTANDMSGDIDTLITGVNVASEDNIDFGAAKKTSLNAATTDLSAITGDKASYKATGFSTHDAAAVKSAIETGGSSLAQILVVTDNLASSATTIVSGTVSWDNTNATTTVFYSDNITEATADHYKGRIIIFTSGAVKDQASDITAYALDTGEGKFTVTALTEAPPNNVTFVIV